MLTIRTVLCLLLLCAFQLSAKTKNSITYVWSGAITDSSATVVALINSKHAKVICLVSDNVKLQAPVYISPSKMVNKNGAVRFDAITGLSPNKQYYYGIKVNGVLQTKLNDNDNGAGNYIGKFKTFPVAGTAANFSFTSSTGHHGSKYASTHKIYTKTKMAKGLFHILTGDFYYCDQSHRGQKINNNATQDAVRANYKYPLTSINQSALYRSTPIVYMWDDHDFGRNDKVGIEEPVAMPNVHAVYRELVPHYPLQGGKLAPITQSFTVGRVRFIITDLYTDSSIKKAPDNSLKTRLGLRQKAWFKRELLKASGTYPAIVWVSTIPWGGTARQHKNAWASYSTERSEIANFIKDNNIQGISIISGDMHGSAIDDGANMDFAANGGAPIPVFQTGPYGRSASYKGGPYNLGSTKRGKPLYLYGLIKIEDNGSMLTTTWMAKNINGIQQSERDGSSLKQPKEIKYTFSYANPVITNLLPTNGSVKVKNSGELTMTFSKKIANGTGEIKIIRLSDNSPVLSIPISNCSIVKNKLLIPYSGLAPATAYYVAIGKSSIKDEKGHAFSGIYNPLNINYKRWTFSTQ